MSCRRRRAFAIDRVLVPAAQFRVHFYEPEVRFMAFLSQALPKGEGQGFHAGDMCWNLQNVREELYCPCPTLVAVCMASVIKDPDLRYLQASTGTQSERFNGGAYHPPGRGKDELRVRGWSTSIGW